MDPFSIIAISGLCGLGLKIGWDAASFLGDIIGMVAHKLVRRVDGKTSDE